jgi:iron complex outermembrane receptor protein
MTALRLFRHAPKALATLLAASAPALPAAAQTVDYGRLQGLFGEPISASATGVPQRVSEAPADLTIIGAEEIQRSGARTLLDVLQHVPGLDLLQTSAGGDVGMRGYGGAGNPRLLVLLNGRQVFMSYYGVTKWATIPVELAEIRQIEIVRGPQSALFGFNAVSGVINIITRSPLYDDTGSATVTAGTQDQHAVSLARSLRDPSGRAGVRLGLGWSGAEEFQTTSDPVYRRGLHDPTRRSLSIDGLVQLTDDLQAGLEASANKSDLFEVTSGGSDSWGLYDTVSVKGSLTGRVGETGLVTLLSYDNTVMGAQPALSSGSPTITYRDHLTVVQAQYLFKPMPDHVLRLSGEFRRDSMGTTPQEGAFVSDDIGSLSGMWNWQITPRLAVTSALRWDHMGLGYDGPRTAGLAAADFRRSIEQLSYNTGLVQRLGDGDTLRLLAGRGIQPPSLGQLGGLRLPLGPGQWGAGNPQVNPASLTSYEVNDDHPIGSLAATWRNGIFFEQYRDIIGQDFPTLALRPDPLSAYLYHAIGRSDAAGLETSLAGSVGPWPWQLSYSLTRVSQQLDVNQFSVLNSPYQLSTAYPSHLAKADIGYAGDDWDGDLLLVWRSATRDVQSSSNGYYWNHVPSGLGTQASIGWRWDRLRLSLGAANVLRSETRLSMAPAVQREIWGRMEVPF